MWIFFIIKPIYKILEKNLNSFWKKKLCDKIRKLQRLNDGRSRNKEKYTYVYKIISIFYFPSFPFGRLLNQHNFISRFTLMYIRYNIIIIITYSVRSHTLLSLGHSYSFCEICRKYLLNAIFASNFNAHYILWDNNKLDYMFAKLSVNFQAPKNEV